MSCPSEAKQMLADVSCLYIWPYSIVFTDVGIFHGACNIKKDAFLCYFGQNILSYNYLQLY